MKRRDLAAALVVLGLVTAGCRSSGSDLEQFVAAFPVGEPGEDAARMRFQGVRRGSGAFIRGASVLPVEVEESPFPIGVLVRGFRLEEGERRFVAGVGSGMAPEDDHSSCELFELCFRAEDGQLLVVHAYLLDDGWTCIVFDEATGRTVAVGRRLTIHEENALWERHRASMEDWGLTVGRSRRSPAHRDLPATL